MWAGRRRGRGGGARSCSTSTNITALALACSLGAFLRCGAEVYSEAWGTQGESWAQSGAQLLDWSYAGYAAGEAPIPDPVSTHDLRLDFGAVGDGVTDDTASLLQAVKTLPANSVLSIPPGIYVITQKVIISKRITIKGAGSGLTVLRFPKSLQDVYGGPDPVIKSSWSTGPGFINIIGSSGLRKLTAITADAVRGSTGPLQVASTSGLYPRSWVVVTISDVGGNVMRDMTGGLAVGCQDPICVGAQNAFRMATRLASVGPGNQVVLERALPFNASTAFRPALYEFAPPLQDLGIVGVTLDFGSGKYKGHFHEEGWNGIRVNKAANVFLKDITIRNADMGIQIGECYFCSVVDVTIEADKWRERGGVTGHHALWAKASQDALFSNFNIATRYVHDLTVETFAIGTVFASGRGVDVTLDSHSMMPVGTLWTDIDVGLGTRTWVFGGDVPRHPPSGPLATFFRLVASGKPGNAIKKAPPSNMGPMLNFIGCGGNMSFPSQGSNPYVRTWHVEKLDPDRLLPRSLHAAQVALRLSSPGYVSSALGGQGYGGASALLA